MGCSLRTGTHLTLDLPNIFWKRLVGEKVLASDLVEVDAKLMDTLNRIRNFSEEEFRVISEDMTFEYFTSGNEKVELIEGGSTVPVTYDQRARFVDAVINLRIHEADKQIESIKRGLFKLVPEPMLMTIPAEDFQVRVCGRAEINFELLRRHTIYKGYTEKDTIIDDFWAMLHSFKYSDQMRFIKFCWGQVRLPSSDEDYENTQTRLMIKKKMLDSQEQTDMAFPKADTCFFNFELPHYSDKQIMKDKILVAINMDCDSMNAENEINEFTEIEPPRRIRVL